MKLTHNLKTPTKPYKHLASQLRGYQNADRQLTASLTPNKWNDTTIEPLYSARSTNIKVCPYESNLVYSQVNDRINQFSNRPYKQNIQTAQKLSITENNGSNNDIQSIKRDIINLKQIIQNTVSNFSVSKIKQQVMEEVTSAMEEHRNQTARSLRSAIIKIDDSTKREYITQFSRQFLPLSYLDDSEKQFSEFQNRIVQLQNEIKQQEIRSNGLDFNQQLKRLQLQIRKNQKQNQQIKFTIRELEATLRNQSIAISQQKAEGIVIDASWERKISQICQAQMQKLSKLKMMKKTKDPQTYEQTEKQRQQAVKQLNDLQLKPTRPKIEQKPSIHHKLQNNKSMSFTFSLDSLTDLSNPQIMSALPESMSSIKDIKSTKYIIDNDNNLLDQSGNYILNEVGKQIRLTQQQITMLKDSNVVKYKQEF